MKHDTDDHAAYLVMLVFPAVALYLLANGPDPANRLVQVVTAVFLVLAAHGPTERYIRMVTLVAVTVALLLVGAGWASPVLPIFLTLIAVASRFLAVRFP